MKQEHLFEAIGLVDDRLVEEAADARRTATPWKKWAALAACLVLVIGIGSLSMSVLFRGCGADMATTEGIVENTAADSTATAPESAGTEESVTMTEETTAETEETAESTAEDSAGGQMESAGVIRTMGCDDGAGLTAVRRIQWTLDDAHTALVEDRYTVTNSGEARTVTFRYPDPGEAATDLSVSVGTAAAEYRLEDGMVTFQAELPAEGTVEITVAYTIASADGTFRVSTEPNGLELTTQSAALVLPEDMTLAASNVNFQASGSAVTLDPAVEEYYFTAE